MDTLKTDKTDTAEAENIETMELLTGMLDNATQCGGADDENPEPEKSGKCHRNTPAEAVPDWRRQLMDSAITQKGDLESLPLCELSCQDSNLERQNQNLLCYHYTTAQSVARKRDKDKQKIVIYNRETEKCPTLAGVQERISLLLHAWSRQAGQRAGRRPAETERLIR